MQGFHECVEILFGAGIEPEDARKWAAVLQQLPKCKLHSAAQQFKDDEGWHTARSTGIGGSDIAAIMGESSWKSPYDIWISKTGQMPTEGQQQQSEAARWGNVLEDSIAYEWARRNNKKIIKIPVSLEANDAPWMLANIDGFVLDEYDRITGILEIKTTSLYNKDTWEVGPVPYYYICQAMWYTMITGLPGFDIVCLVGGQHLYSYYFPIDQELCECMKKAAYDFWHANVLGMKEPEVQATDLEKLQKQELEETEPAKPFVDETDATNNLVTAYIEMRDKIGALEKVKEELYAQIWSSMQRHDAMMTQSNVITVKRTNRRSCDLDMLARDFPEAYDACVTMKLSTSLNIK